MHKQSLLELLADNQLGELFDALKDKQGYYKDLILLESQWNDLRAKQRNDLISNEDASVELGQIRHSLLELIELSDTPQVPATSQASNSVVTPKTWIIVVGALTVLLILFEIYRFVAAPQTSETASGERTGSTASPKPAVSPGALDVSGAQALTFSAGDSYYERVYSLVKTKVESTGGGKSLITLSVGLHFKGSINYLLTTEKFRLYADALPGPLAPANYIGTLANAGSYVEGDIKFELSDQVRSFTVVIEGDEEKRWVFSR